MSEKTATMTLEEARRTLGTPTARAALRSPRPPWILASQEWAKTKDRRDRINGERAAGGPAVAPTPTVKDATASALQRLGIGERAGRVLIPDLTAAAVALLAAWVSLCPLAPQQAKREAVIAIDPVHAPVELVSRQRAAEQSARWGW